MQLQVGVKVLLKNEEGKYLLVHRNPKIYPEVPNPWDIVGGRIDPGSGLIDNLRREVKEETGLEIISQPKLIAAQDILRIQDKHIVRLTYIGQTQGEPHLSEEHDHHAWFTLAEMKTLTGLDKYFAQILDQIE